MSMVLRKRPVVKFDPTDANHRKLAHQFIKDAKWGANSPEFFTDMNHGSLAFQIRETLLNWYISQDKV